MVVDLGTDADTRGLTLSVPREGLDTVLRYYSGRGQLLLDAIASRPPDDGIEVRRDWSRSDVDRRIARVMFQRLLPALSAWPTSASQWLEAIPVELLHERLESEHIQAGVSWPETRRKGWPPRRFSIRRRSRTSDAFILTALRWTLDELMQLADQVESIDSSIVGAVRAPLSAARTVVEIEPLRSTEAIRPPSGDLAALRGAGRPWAGVALVAAELLRLRSNQLDGLVEELIWPDPDLRGRLFHLGVLGVVLKAAADLGAAVEGKTPVLGGTKGPTFEIRFNELTWQLWFEAAGIWNHYGHLSPYREATRGLRDVSQPIGADLVLIREGHSALIIECKYSSNLDVVARQGFHQVAAYVLELRSRLVENVRGVVVGPEEIVTNESETATLCGPVGFVPPGRLGPLVRSTLSGGVP